MSKDSTISITFKLDGDGKGFKMLAADADGFKTAVSGAIKEAEKLNTGAINFAAISDMVTQAQSAISTMQSAFKDLSDAYEIQETAETQLATAMRNTMGATDSQIQSIKDLCSAQQDLGVIGDEVQLKGAQELATYLTMTDTLKTLIPVMNDMVAQQYGLAASGENAAQIASMLGKVMNGQVNALSRYGYTFDEAQENILKFGDETQRAAVLAEVISQSVGGMNEALAKTDSGKQKQLENTLGDIKEKLGQMTNAALPFVTIAANTMIALGGIVKLSMGVKTATAALGAFSLKGTAMAAACKLMGIESNKSAAMVRIFSGAMKNGAYSATAMKLSVRGLMIATGVGAAIWALTKAIEYLTGATDKATDSTNELIDAEKRAEREAQYLEQLHQQETSALENTRAALAINISKLKEFNGSEAEEKKLVDEMNNTYGETMGYFSSVSDWYDALIANSEDYCKQMILEARTRMLANQIVQKQQENEKIQKGLDKGEYSTNVAHPGGDWTPHINWEKWKIEYTKVPGSDQSDYDKAKAAIKANNQAIEAYTNELNKDIAEIAEISFSVRGSNVRPTTTTPTANVTPQAQTPTEAERAAAIDVTEVMGRNCNAVVDFDKAIDDLRLKQKYANAEEYKEIQKNIDALVEEKDTFLGIEKHLTEAERAAAIDVTEVMGRNRTAVVDYDKAIDDLRLKQKYANAEEYKEIQLNIDALNAEKDAFTSIEPEPLKVNDNAKTLQDISSNIDILTERLQTATIEEAALINQQIELWNKKADAIKEAGKVSKATFETYRSGWGAIKNLDGAVTNITETLKSNGTVWEKTKAIVDGFISAYDGINAIVGIVKLLTAASKAHTIAKTGETAATVSATAAEAANATAAPIAAAAETPLIAANKATTASFLELAAASYFAAHAYIPFAGFGIATGFVTSATAITKSLGVTAFADGGIAYGPTLGLFAEYAGASHNPEVVAPLDKLRSMLNTDGGEVGKVEFKISGENLVGVLNKRTNHIKRTL